MELNEAIKLLREKRGISQRKLARKADMSYKTLQLIEGKNHDPKISSLNKVAMALGKDSEAFSPFMANYFASTSIWSLSLSLSHATNDWRYSFFDFVDEFRRVSIEEKYTMIREAPSANLEIKLRVLLASTVEYLCKQHECEIPWWTRGVLPLNVPWFLAGVENLKAMAILESPLAFKKRQVFVLSNFLERA